MENKKLRVCIIGAGFITGTQHIPAINKLKDRLELAGVADCREDALIHIAKTYGIKNIYTDPMEMLDKEKPDLVHVCTANNTHKHFTIEALRRGANVLCEKPLALTLRDAQEMLAEAKKAGKLLMTCQNSRIGAVQEMKKIVDSQELGEIYYTEIENIRRRGVPTWGRFHSAEDNGGGPFCDLGVHYLDSALYVLGNPAFTSVSANTWRKVADRYDANQETLPAMTGNQPFLPRNDYDRKEFTVEDYAAGLVRFQNGMQMQMKFAWAVNLPKADAYRFAGTKNGMVYRKGENLENPISLYGQQGDNLVDAQLEVEIAKPGAMEDFGHKGIIENMADAIQKGTPRLITEEEMLNVAAIIEAFYLSAAENREVRADELEQFA